MIDLILRKMTDEQKQMVIDAPKDDVACKVESNGKGLYRGLVSVAKKGNACVRLTVAKTGLVFNDDAAAFDIMEDVVKELRSSESKETSKPKPKKKPPKKKPAAKKKI